MSVRLNTTRIIAKFDLIVTIFRLNSRDYFREKIGQITSPSLTFRREGSPIFEIPPQPKLSVRFFLPSVFVAYIYSFCIFFFFFFEKAASRDPLSFELSLIDQHSSNSKPNKNNSNILGVNIPVGMGSFKRMAGSDDVGAKGVGCDSNTIIRSDYGGNHGNP